MEGNRQNLVHIEKPKKYKVLISKDALLDIESTKNIFLTLSNIANMLKIFLRGSKRQQTLYYIFNLFCYRGLHCDSDPSVKGQNVLAVHYKENAKNKQIRADKWCGLSASLPYLPSGR